MPSSRVLCIGNDWAHDDGVGWVVAERLRERVSADVEIVTEVEVGLGNLEHLVGVDQLIVVDALANGGQPGRIERLEVSQLPLRDDRSCGHVISLASLLALAQRLYPDAFPSEIVVLGVEVQNLDRFGAELSPPVARAVPQLVTRVLEELDPRKRAVTWRSIRL